MGLFDLATDLFTGDFTSLAGDLIGAGDLGLSQPTTFVSYQQPGQYSMPLYSEIQPQPVMAAAPALAGAAAGVARWASRFPNLWQAIQKVYANYRTRVTPEKLYSIMKKYGPTFLSSVIGAAAVSELLVYKSTHKRRYMNVANTKALRRSLRRLKGFETLSHRVTAQLSRSCHRRSSKRGGAAVTMTSYKNR